MDESLGRIKWMSVETAMTRDVVSVKATDKVKDAWLTLMEADVSGAPVVGQAGEIVGILSITDIHRAIFQRVQKARSLRESQMQNINEEELEKEELRELTLAIRAAADSTVEMLLPRDQKLLTLSPHDSLDRAIRLMAEHSVNRLPVVKDNKVEGIVSRQDIIWLVAGRPEKEKHHEPADGT